ncbi:MAG: hypothetical protein PHU85_16660 [Phycisphaerae bacterium]|nr:hypothetical protein [Phycisphaerae bacterium]
MNQTRWAVLLLGAACLLATALAGCSNEDMLRWNRRFKVPDDYKDSPLGAAFDTPTECRALRDERLRTYMDEWFKLREQYRAAWRRNGLYDDQTRRITRRRSTLKAVIQDRVSQLQAMGEPLTGGD